MPEKMTQQEYLQGMKQWADGERLIPEAFTGGISNVMSHFSHWQQVSELLNEGDKAIEVGCGCGMSSRIYSLKTKRPFVAIDKPEVVQFSRMLYPTPGVLYGGADFNEDAWAWQLRKTERFDAVICVDVIEHVQQKEVFLESLASLGHEKTRWIITAPIGEDQNPWHVHHWKSVEEFLDDVCRYIPVERIIRV